ncbi:MAG: ABC transporter ATP-binding protein [Chloroflexi bacterium HGW-Chloroflexi-10]|nr:MAG: ABC transporter ATP-binding protein [Chloroflexi bacterium HGW-Chloroflexi-10]
MTSVAIKTMGLSRSFDTVQALDQVSFEVESGVVFGFLGPNGSGKTTTIRLLLGLLEPSAGRAEVLGMDPIRNGQEVRENCGALLEQTGLYERLSAEDNLDFYGRVWRMPGTERKTRIKELLDKMGLYDRRGEIVKGWSRGMKQKLAVARAMLHRPKIVFLDEPTAGLDPVASAAFREDLQTLASQSGVTVFLTTHNLTEAEKLCQQVAVIRKGKLLSVGSPDALRLQKGGNFIEVVGSGFTQSVITAIKQEPMVADVTLQDQHLRIDLKNGSESASLVPFLIGQGVLIEEVRKGKASLEDVFLTLMEEENV